MLSETQKEGFIQDFCGSELTNLEIADKYSIGLRTVSLYGRQFGLPDRLRVRHRTFVPKSQGSTPSYEELMALMKQYSTVSLRGVPCREYTVAIETDKPIAVVFMSDLHLGSPGVDYALLEKDLDLICNTDRLYLYFGGDAIENMVLPVFGVPNQLDTGIQVSLLTRILEKVYDKIIAVGSGNHDLWSQKLTGIDIVGRIIRDKKLLHTKHGGILNVQLGNMPYTIMRRHSYRFNCLTGDTKIRLCDGTAKTIEELSHMTESYLVCGLDTRKDGNVAPTKASPACVTGENVPVYKINLDNGCSFKATDNHLVMIKSGRSLSSYKRVDELKSGDCLMPFGCGNSLDSKEIVVVSVEYLGIVDKVYDIETGTHNFGLDCGVFVHNSSYNLTHAVKQMMRFEDRDFQIGIVEHGHVPSVEEFYMRGEKRIAIRPGSYKYLWDEYADSKGFTGVRPMNPTVILNPNKQEILSFMDMNDAIRVLGSIS